MSEPVTLRMAFRLNQKKVLRDLILHQAGTIEKACVEGVMNGVDAGATKISVEIGEKTIRIVDNGKGFRSLQEIQDWFGTIGMEHDPSERKRFGRFRMGRGQLFKFGRNCWRSNTFAMDVDIRSEEWEDNTVPEPPFQVTQGLEKVKGCDITIDLYEPLVPSDALSISRELGRMIKYVDVEVSVNGAVVNKDPAKQKWDIVTDDAYINLRDTGALTVFNDGIYVMTISSYRYGTGGEIVSRGPFTGINYARNDIDASDPKWRRIRKLIEKRSTENVRKKPRLSDHEREFVAKQLADGTYDAEDARDMRILFDVTGRAWAPGTLENHLQRHSVPAVTVAPEGDFKADTLMQKGLAFVFASRTLDMFGVETLEELIAVLEKRVKNFDWPRHTTVLDYERATAGLSDRHRIVDDESLTAKERFLINFLRSIYHRCCGCQEKPRRLVVGESETANGWTDGATYIALRRDHVQRAESLEGWLYIAELIHHEQTHQDATTEQHNHTPEFYRAFHDTLREGFLRRFVGYAVAEFPSALAAADRSLTRRQARTLDKLAKAGHSQDAVFARMKELERLEKVAESLAPSRRKKTARARQNEADAAPEKTTEKRSARRHVVEERVTADRAPQLNLL